MTDACSLSPQLPALKLRIAGHHVDPMRGGTLAVVNPATGEKSCDVFSATAADVGKNEPLEGDLQTKAAWMTLPSGI
jgi:hypothetical protein